MLMDNPGRFLNADDFDDDDNDDKSQPIYIYGQRLFKKAIDIVNITTTICDLLPEEPGERTGTASMMLDNAYRIPAKIKGAMALDVYSLMMENAVVIKVNVVELKTQLWACSALHGVEKKYTEILEKEIAAFKALFIQWVKAFDKTNDLPDDWHLFNDPSSFPEDAPPFNASDFFDSFDPDEE